MTIRVFLCDILPGDDRHLPGLLARLDDAERDRAARFAFDRSRLSYAAAHALLRHALNVVAGASPSFVRGKAWRFAVDGFGKPRLDPPFDDIRFNLTHADGLVAVAVTRGRDVGIDVEEARRDPDAAMFANMVLAPEESAELADHPERLMRIWVAKEALVKAIGLGLSLPLREIVLLGEPPRLVALPAAHGAPADWSILTERHGNHWLAVAMRGDAPIAREAITVARLAAPMP